ncbi:GxxExxY protein [Proteinivorax hydrogeniformans]|uniref:GxxExxY protein n=1 Tax=Proteinivorax hydrogeniformans TaxID=1826727 RepID=A0AAU8HWX8_9FIRM
MLVYEQLSGEIVRACYEVHRVLGSKLLEKSYEDALSYELELRGVNFKQQFPINLQYKGKEIGSYFADLLVEDKIILELKCVSNLSAEHYAQLLHYLNASNYALGILINFGTKELQVKRLLRTSEAISKPKSP